MYEAQKRYYLKNKETIKQKQKEKYKENPEKFKDNVKKWRDKNPEKFNKSARKYYWKNVERLRPIIAERQRKYNAIKNPFRKLSDTPSALYQREWRQSFKKIYGISWNQIYRNGRYALVAVDKAKRKCEKCESIENLHIHHKDNRGRNRIKKGLKPNNSLNNLMVLCRSCHAILHGEQKRKECEKI